MGVQKELKERLHDWTHAQRKIKGRLDFQHNCIWWKRRCCHMFHMLTSCISRLYMAHSLSIATVMAILMAHCYRHTYGTLLWTYVWHTVTDIHMAHCYGPTYGTLLWTYVWHTLRISVIFHMLTSCISRLYMAHSLSIATVMDIVMAHCYGHTYGALLWTYLWQTVMDILMAHCSYISYIKIETRNS